MFGGEGAFTTPGGGSSPYNPASQYANTTMQSCRACFDPHDGSRCDCVVRALLRVCWPEGGHGGFGDVQGRGDAMDGAACAFARLPHARGPCQSYRPAARSPSLHPGFWHPSSPFEALRRRVGLLDSSRTVRSRFSTCHHLAAVTTLLSLARGARLMMMGGGGAASHSRTSTTDSCLW